MRTFTALTVAAMLALAPAFTVVWARLVLREPLSKVQSARVSAVLGVEGTGLREDPRPEDERGHGRGKKSQKCAPGPCGVGWSCWKFRKGDVGDEQTALLRGR